MTYNGTVETLGDLKRFGMGLAANCSGPYCGHSQALPLDDLIEKYGADYSYVGDKLIGRACRCQQCRYRGATLTVIANTAPAWQR